MDKIILSLAPIGNIKGKLDIDRLVDEVISCRRDTYEYFRKPV